MNALEQSILNKFKQEVASLLPLHKMVLFGSRARGDGDDDSDMDVLVVLNVPVDAAARHCVAECAWKAGFDDGIVVVPIAVSRQEWEEGPDRSSLLALAVAEDGVAV